MRFNFHYRLGSDTKLQKRDSNGEAIDENSTRGYSGYAKILRYGKIELLYFEGGNLRKGTCFNMNGNKIWEQTHNIDGTLREVEVWKPSGEKCPETNLKDGSGTVVYYDENGQIQLESNYKEEDFEEF